MFEANSFATSQLIRRQQAASRACSEATNERVCAFIGTYIGCSNIHLLPGAITRVSLIVNLWGPGLVRFGVVRGKQLRYGTSDSPPARRFLRFFRGNQQVRVSVYRLIHRVRQPPPSHW